MCAMPPVPVRLARRDGGVRARRGRQSRGGAGDGLVPLAHMVSIACMFAHAGANDPAGAYTA